MNLHSTFLFSPNKALIFISHVVNHKMVSTEFLRSYSNGRLPLFFFQSQKA